MDYLNPANNLPKLSKTQIVDDEDSRTKYFIREANLAKDQTQLYDILAHKVEEERFVLKQNSIRRESMSRVNSGAKVFPAAEDALATDGGGDGGGGGGGGGHAEPKSDAPEPSPDLSAGDENSPDEK